MLKTENIKKPLFIAILAFPIIVVVAINCLKPKNVQTGKDFVKIPKKKKTPEERALFDEARVIDEFKRLQDPNLGYVPRSEIMKELSNAELAKQWTLVKKQSFSISSGLPETNTYVNRGPSNLGGRTRALVVDRSDNTGNTILAAGVSGGVFRTTNGGTSWTRVSPLDDIPNVTTIIQDPRTGFEDVWYYGTGESLSGSTRTGASGYYGRGIWQSTDGGLTWSQFVGTDSTQETFDDVFDFVYKLAIDPTTGYLFAALPGVVQFYLPDGALPPYPAGWYSIKSLPSCCGTSQVTDVTISSTGQIYMAFGDGFAPFDADRGIWTTSSITSPRTQISSGNFLPDGRPVLALAPSNEDKLYVLFGNGNNADCADTTPLLEADLWMWNEDTDTWTDYSTKLPDESGCSNGNDPFAIQSGYNLVVSVKPDDEDFVVIGGTNAYKIEDIANDATFTRIGGYASASDYSIYDVGGTEHHPDLHAMVFNPFDNDVLFTGSDGGVHKTNDITAGTVSWVSLNNNYQTQQYYHVAIDPLAGSDFVLGGLQDNGTNSGGTTAGESNLTEQTRVFGGDGVAVAISRDNVSIPTFVGYQYGSIYRRTRDLTPQFGTEITPDGSSSQFVTYFFLDPDNNKTLYYAGNDRVYRTNDATNVITTSWTDMGATSAITDGGVSGEYPQVFSTTWGAYNASSSYLLIGTDNGNIYKLNDPQNVTDISGAINITPSSVTSTAGLYVSGLAIHPTNSDIVLATYSNYGVSSIYLTTNATSATPTWTLVERNLSSHSIRSAAIVEASGEIVYFVGTGRGLYSCTDPTSTDWELESPNGIGLALVRSLAYRPSDNHLLIGTHGNGMFEAILGSTMEELSGATDILAFVLDEQKGPAEIDDVEHHIDIEVVFGTERTNLAPVIEVSEGATIELTSTGAPGNFENDVEYTVTAKDLTEQKWTVSVTVAPNTAPSFTVGADQMIDEDAGAQRIEGWATDISDGDDETQTLTFAVTGNTKVSLFSTPPAVSAEGTLTYEPAANTHGSADVTVRLSDDGGTENGGEDISPAQTFTITVNSVNDIPSFTAGSNQMIDEDTGAQSIAGWAADISDVDTDIESLIFEVTMTSDNKELFTNEPAVSTDGTLTYEAAANAHGSAEVTVRLFDGEDTSPDEMFTITVNSVNDIPSFTAGSNQMIDEDTGAQSIAGWATEIIDVDTDIESLIFEVTMTSDNAELFTNEPAVSTDGTLTYEAAANAHGSAEVTVRLFDGEDTSPDEMFTITVNSVNDIPSFTAGSNQMIDEDAGAQSIAGWAADISDVDTDIESLIFEVTTDNTELFTNEPAVSTDGTLTYEAAANAHGSAEVTVKLSDGEATSPAQTFTITVNPVNDAPTISEINDKEIAKNGSLQGMLFSLDDVEDNLLQLTATSSNTDLVTADGIGLTALPNNTYALSVTPLADVSGTTTLTIEVSDGALSTTETFVLSVTEEEEEICTVIAIAQQDITVTLDANGAYILEPEDVDNGSYSTCDGDVELNFAGGATEMVLTCDDTGSPIEVTLVVSNDTDLTQTFAQVTVEDNTDPVALTRDITVQLSDDGQVVLDPEDVDDGSFDTCSGIASMTLDTTTFLCPELGKHTVTLTVTDTDGNQSSRTATVTIDAQDSDRDGTADSCEFATQGFSPNGDGTNDTWVISNKDYPNNTLKVYNERGILVYQTNDYQNDWDGFSNQGWSGKLPPGSYYYIFNPNEAGMAPMTGWIYMDYGEE